MRKPSKHQPARATWSVAAFQWIEQTKPNQTDMKANVTIQGRDNFTGVVLAETTTHLLVAWGSNEKGEWFARNSKMVNCELMPE